MNPRESSSPQWWEERLVADYREHRWRQLMEPMCRRMEKWKAGELTSAEIEQAFEECYQKITELRHILNQRSDRAALLIQVLDREWFEEWIREHTPPPHSPAPKTPDAKASGLCCIASRAEEVPPGPRPRGRKPAQRFRCATRRVARAGACGLPSGFLASAPFRAIMRGQEIKMPAERPQMVKLSKFLSLILRHQPERFGLKLDEEGWASLPEVMEILQGLPNFRWATRADVLELVEKGSGDGKQRFEVVGERIRARYGHSVPLQADLPPCTPPDRLYHGTSPRALKHIRQEGLRPMRRQYVHLSADRETAVRVGARHAPNPVVLIVRAAEAARAGILFYQADPSTYLVKTIPPEFLEFPEEA